MISKILQISPHFELRYEQIDTPFGLHERVIKQAIGTSSSLACLLKREYEQLLALESRSPLRFNQAIGYVPNRLLLTYINGESFHQSLKKSQTWTFQQKLKLSIDLTQQIDLLHHLGFVHLDLSPSNLICDQQNLLWLIDWMSAIDLRKTSAELLAFAKIKYSHPQDWPIFIQQRNQANLQIHKQSLDLELRQRLIKRDRFALYCILYEIWLDQPLFLISQAQLFEYQKLSFFKDTQAIDQFQRWGESCLSAVHTIAMSDKIRKILHQIKLSLIEGEEMRELVLFFERVHNQDQ
jgi:hypothetical protein